MMDQRDIEFIDALPDPRDNWDALDQTAKNDCFDVNKAVPKSEAFNVDRFRASEDFRSGAQALLDLSYSPEFDDSAVDIYPADDPYAPCLVFFHGGWWQRNSKNDFAIYASGPLAMGWSVAVVGYPLAPKATLTEIQRQAEMSIDWLATHGARYGVDGPLVVGGWSAGAMLAHSVLAKPEVIAGMVMAGLYQFESFRDTMFNNAVQITEEECQTLAALNLPPVEKPLLIAIGTNDVEILCHESFSLARKRAANGTDSKLLLLDGADHFTILNELRDANSQTLTALAELIGTKELS